MPDLTPRGILDAIHEGVMESALLAARGYGRPISEQSWDRLTASQPYPDEWIRIIARAVTGRPNASIGEVIAAPKHGPSNPANPSG
jgi:hypothetical protein